MSPPQALKPEALQRETPCTRWSLTRVSTQIWVLMPPRNRRDDDFPAVLDERYAVSRCFVVTSLATDVVW